MYNTNSWEMRREKETKKTGWIQDNWESRLGEMILGTDIMLRQSGLRETEFSRYLLCIKMHLSVRDWIKNWSILIIFSLNELWFFNTSLNSGHSELLDLFRLFTQTHIHIHSHIFMCTHNIHRLIYLFSSQYLKYINFKNYVYGYISLAHSTWIIKMVLISLCLSQYCHLSTNISRFLHVLY